METQTDVSGMQCFKGQVDKEMRYFGQGKDWTDGIIYIGGYYKDRKTQGKNYELQRDNTYTLFHVKYDEDEEEIERREISKGLKEIV